MARLRPDAPGTFFHLIACDCYGRRPHAALSATYAPEPHISRLSAPSRLIPASPFPPVVSGDITVAVGTGNEVRARISDGVQIDLTRA